MLNNIHYLIQLNKHNHSHLTISLNPPDTFKQYDSTYILI